MSWRIYPLEMMFLKIDDSLERFQQKAMLTETRQSLPEVEDNER
jgi:hypothetical protein